MTPWSPEDFHLLQTIVPVSVLDAVQQPTAPEAAWAASCTQLTTALEALTPFVPAPVLDLHLAEPERGRIGGLYLDGTVLLADLSGFTALSSQLAGAERQGSEEISALMNGLFASLLEVVHTYGGQVIQFGGDALSAFFDRARLDVDHAALASTVALTMQARMVAFAAVPTSSGPVPLRLRIALHSGRVFAAEVGDAGHTELVVTGAVINRLVIAQERAAPGEVVITEETLSALGAAYTQIKQSGLYLLNRLARVPDPPPRATPAWQPGPPTLSTVEELLARIRAVQPFTPHDLPERFLQGAQGGEFRPVTVLFASFYTFHKLLALLQLVESAELDPAIVGRVLNTYYTQTQLVVQHYGGSINKVDMATFGNRVLALFGAPVAHEDDPVRAVQAALTLRSEIEEVDQEVAALLREWSGSQPEQGDRLLGAASAQQRSGIASGTVFAGLMGTPQRHEYTVMGETVNLAARILTAADTGNILITSRTNRAVRYLIEAHPLPPVTLKGVAQPVPIFRAVQERPDGQQRPPSTPLVGRQAELGQLLDLAGRALGPGATAGRVIGLVGEAGMGKSRLAAEVLDELGTLTPQAQVVRDSCQSYEQKVPYALIARVLRQLLRVDPRIPREEQAALVADQLPYLLPDWSRFTPLLGPILNLPLADTPLTAALTPEQRRDRLHDLIIRAIFALDQRQPLVLAIDDLQWIDASSQSVLVRLTAEMAGHPLLVLLIYREMASGEDPWCDLTHCTTIRMEEFTMEENHALVRALLHSEPPPELGPVVERSDGTPLFLEETVRYLLESGALAQRTDGSWIVIRPLDHSAVPAQVEQLITARLDQLDDAARQIAQVAAVIGPRFSERLLAAVAPQLPDLTQHLGALVHGALLVHDDNSSGTAYRFRHTSIRDVAYTSLLFARRRELHAQVAAAIEGVYAGELEENRAVLVQHYHQAEQWPQAFAQYLQAAGQAQARYAHSEAIALYEQAQAIAPWREDVAPDVALAATLHENLGDVLTLTSDYAGARTAYEQLLALLAVGNAGDYALRRATLERKIGSTYEHQANLTDALHWLGRAAATLAVAPSDDSTALETAHILSDTGWAYFRQGDLAQAEAYLTQALAQISSQVVYADQARILNRLGAIAWNRNDITLAQYYVERNLNVSVQSGDLISQANALNNMSVLAKHQGELADSVRYGLEAIEINERMGRRREIAIAAINVGFALYYQEQYDDAYKYFLQALERSAEVHDTYHQMLAYIHLGRALTGMGQWEAAERAVQQSQALAIELNKPGDELEADVALGQIALAQDDIDKAVQHYQRGLLLPMEQDCEEYGKFQRLEAQIALAQGDKERAERLLIANAELFQNMQNVPEADRTRKLLRELANKG